MTCCPNCGTIHQYNTEGGLCFPCIQRYFTINPPPEGFAERVRKSIDLVVERERNKEPKLTPATPPSLSQRFNQLARMYENSANHCTPGSELQSVLEDAASRIRRILAGDEQMMEFLDLNAPLEQENKE